MILTRFPNWQGLLDQFLQAHRSDRFAYGTWDCCLFACGAVLEMTGTDIAAPFRGIYASRKEAMSAVRAYAGRASVLAVASKVTADFEMAVVPTLRLQRGDVALVKRGHQDYSLGIVALNGSDIVVATGAGLAWTPITTAASGWRI